MLLKIFRRLVHTKSNALKLRRCLTSTRKLHFWFFPFTAHVQCSCSIHSSWGRIKGCYLQLHTYEKNVPHDYNTNGNNRFFYVILIFTMEFFSKTWIYKNLCTCRFFFLNVLQLKKYNFFYYSRIKVKLQTGIFHTSQQKHSSNHYIQVSADRTGN